MADIKPAETIGPAYAAIPAAEARAAARVVRDRVTDPVGRAEILAALGLPDEPGEDDDGDLPTYGIFPKPPGPGIGGAGGGLVTYTDLGGAGGSTPGAAEQPGRSVAGGTGGMGGAGGRGWP